jgi:hypothetical protein
MPYEVPQSPPTVPRRYKLAKEPTPPPVVVGKRKRAPVDDGVEVDGAQSKRVKVDGDADDSRIVLDSDDDVEVL